MIEVQVVEKEGRFWYHVTYRIDSVICTAVECQELRLAVEEVEQKMRLEMGLAKGKRFLTKAGREI